MNELSDRSCNSEICPPAAVASPQRWGPLPTLGWVLILVGASQYGGAYLLYGIAVLIGRPDLMGDMSYLIIGILFLQTLIVVPVLYGLTSPALGVNRAEFLPLRRLRPDVLIGWTLIVLVLSYAISAMLVYLAGRETLPDFVADVVAADAPWLMLMGVVLMAPLAEELLFRGFLISGLRKSFLGDYGAILLSALLWTMIHVQYEFIYLIGLFALGVLLGLSRIATNSVWPALIAHALNNAIAMAIGYLAAI